MARLKAKRVAELSKMGGKREGDQPVCFVTATEIRELASAWLLLDKIDADIARVIDPEEARGVAGPVLTTCETCGARGLAVPSQPCAICGGPRVVF